MRHFDLSGGDRLPALGLGTWKSAPGEVGPALAEALRLGYRHIDCAAIYGNEAEIGAALQQAFAVGDVRREELWVTSKLWNDSHAPGDVQPALEQTLRDLRLEYLDLYLMHWPVALRKGTGGPQSAEDFVALADCPLADTFGAMTELKQAGLCRNIGVSNFSVKKLTGLIESGAGIPAVNQVEMHPYLAQAGLVDFCGSLGIVLTAYSPLGSPDRPEGLRASDEPVLLEDSAVVDIARNTRNTPAQVLLAWGMARGTSVIPKSVNPKRLAENFGAAGLELTAGDLATIDGLDRHRRYVDGQFWVVDGGPYDLAGLWDEPGC